MRIILPEVKANEGLTNSGGSVFPKSGMKSGQRWSIIPHVMMSFSSEWVRQAAPMIPKLPTADLLNVVAKQSLELL